MKRMVSDQTIHDFDDRITALEQGGSGGTEYTAGNGIDITENVISLANPINEATIYTVNSEGVYIKSGEDTIMSFTPGSNLNFLYITDDSKPFEITNYKDAAVVIDGSGLISIRTVDGQSTTTYTFKADGIYIGNTKITN